MIKASTGLALRLGLSMGRGGVSFPEWDAVRREVDAQGGIITDEWTLKNAIRDLKRGSGGSGNMYENLDAMYGLAYIIDGANKVSSVLDLAPTKDPSYGTGGYYHAAQSTASLQQRLSRADNKGNLFKSSGDLSNLTYWGGSVGGTGTAAVRTANFAAAPDGSMTATRLQFSLNGGTASTDSSRITHAPPTTAGRDYIYSFWAKLNSGTPATINLQTVNGGGVTNRTITSAWAKIEVSVTASGSVGLFLGIRGGTGNPDTIDIIIAEASFRESTWDADYIPTTSAPEYAGLDGKPVVMFDAVLGTGAGYTSGTIETKAQPGAIFAIARKDGGGSTVRCLVDGSGDTRWSLQYSGNTTHALVYAGVAQNIVTDQSTWAQFTFLVDGGSSILRRNMAQIGTASPGASQMGGNCIIGMAAGGVVPHNGPIAGLLLYRTGTLLNAAQIDCAEGVLNNYWPSTV